MREYEYEQFSIEKKQKFFSVRAVLGRSRSSRRRKRDVEERNMLLSFDKARFLKWQNDKTLEIIDLRYFKINLTPNDFS